LSRDAEDAQAKMARANEWCVRWQSGLAAKKRRGMPFEQKRGNWLARGRASLDHDAGHAARGIPPSPPKLLMLTWQLAIKVYPLPTVGFGQA